MFYGAGAGGNPTASAVMGDVVSVARQLAAGSGLPAASADQQMPLLDFDEITTRYWIGLCVSDAPGVLARIAGLFGEQGVSIESMNQQAQQGEDGAVLRILTHHSSEAALRSTVEQLRALDSVRSVSSVMRVEGN